jgi:hypothetical protein
MADAKLRVLIEADDKASKALKDLDSQIQSVSTTARNLGLAFTAAGGLMLGAFGLATKAYAEQEVGIMRLDNAMKNMGLSYDMNKDSLEAWIDAEQQKTAIADTEQRDSLATLILMTGNLTQAQDYLQLAMDVSAGTGRDLAGATQLIQYALSGNWGMLQRYIPALKDAQTEEQKWMMLRDMFAGQAETYGKTLSGQMQLLKNNIGDIKEALGSTVAEAILPATQWFNQLTQQVKSTNPEFLKLVTIIGVGAGGATLIGGFGLLGASVLPQAVAGFKLANDWIVKMGFSVKALAGELALLLAGLAMIGFGIYGLQKNAEIERLNTEIEQGYKAALAGTNEEYVKALEHKEALGYALSEEEKKYISGVKAMTEYNAQLRQQSDEQEALNAKIYEEIMLRERQSRYGNRIAVNMAYIGMISAVGGEFTNLTPEQQAGWEDIYSRMGIPSKQHGGLVERTGLIYAHQGETVIPRDAKIINNIYLDGHLITQQVMDDIFTQFKLQGGR